MADNSAEGEVLVKAEQQYPIEKVAEGRVVEEDDDDDDDDLFKSDQPDPPAPDPITNNREDTNASVKHEHNLDESSGAVGAIPRKTSTNGNPEEEPSSTTMGMSSGTTNPPPSQPNNGPSFGLPNGVSVPTSVHASLLQGKLLDALNGLPVQLINDALTEYDDAVQIKGGAIRNHGAYLYGVIKRYVNVQLRASRGEGDGILPMGQDLTPAVQERLLTLVKSGFCTEEEMNDKVKSKIRMLSEKDALVAIDELASVERDQIRNFGSYFMGILNRYMRGQSGHSFAGKAGQNKNSYSDGRNGPGSRYDNRRNNYDDRRRDHRDGDGRGRDRDRSYRSNVGSNHDSYRRERSRDRYDEDRRTDHYSRRGAESGRDNSRFGPRQHPPPHQYPSQQQQPQLMGGMMAAPPPPQRIPAMNSYSQHQPPQPYVHQNQQQQQPMYQPTPGDQNQFVSQMGNAGAPYQNHQQHPPPPSRPGMPMQQPMQQPMAQQQPMQQPPMQQPMAQQQQQNMMPRQMVPGQQQSQQQHYIGNQPAQAAPVMMNQHQPQHQPYVASQQQQQQQPPPPAYMGTQQRMQQPPPNQPGGTSYGQAPGGWQGQQQVPVDIMGLADKAASAVQALASQNKLQQQPLPGNGPSASGPPYSAGPPPPIASSYPSMQAPPNMAGAAPPPRMSYSNAPQQQPSVPYNAGQGATSQNRFRRRATATAGIEELPVMVQYAVQNLQASGQVDGPLDEGMLGMIKDLPESLALAALQKFSSIDKNTMRNKTAYLAGVLRRELERINRR